jgi:hypothetical protein
MQVDSRTKPDRLVTGPAAHRTDLKRGKLMRVAPGVYCREHQPEGPYTIRYTVEGRSHKQTLPANTTLPQAKRALAAKQVAVDRGEAVTPSKITLAEVAADYLETFSGLVATGERSQRTLALHRQQWRCHLEPR